MLNIDRYRHVDITAKEPGKVLKFDEEVITKYTDFILRCSSKVECINFADQEKLTIYAKVESGQLVWWDNDYILSRPHDDILQKTLRVLGYTGEGCENRDFHQPPTVEQDKERQFLVGQLG